MKTLFLLFILFLSSLAATAQPEDSVSVKSSNLWLGVSLNTISFHIYYKADKTPGTVRSGYFVPVSLNVGYQLTNRIKLKVGVGAGGDKDEDDVHLQDSKQRFQSQTIAITTPVSAYLTFLKLKKKIPVYGVVAVVPAYGFTTTEISTTDDEGTKNSTIKDSGINVFTIAGVGFNYKVSERFYGNVSYFFYKTNLNGPNSFYYDWDQGYPGARGFIKSLELGLNYKL